MKTISIYMQAGGVGKTSFTVMLAYELAKNGKVLIIDADQQSNTTLQFVKDFGTVQYVIDNPELIKKCCTINDIESENIIEELNNITDFCNEYIYEGSQGIKVSDFFSNEDILNEYCEKFERDSEVLNELYKMISKFATKNCRDFVSVLREDAELEDAILEVRSESESLKGLYILPSRNTNTKLQNFYESGDFRDEPEIIPRILKEAEKLGFEYVFFDLPPTFGWAQKILLSYCDIIIPIINPDEKSIDGLMQFNEHMDKLKKEYKGKFTETNLLIINREKKDNKVHQHWIEVLKNSPYTIFEFPDSNSITSAASQKLVLQEWQKSSKLCTTIKELADEVIKGE